VSEQENVVLDDPLAAYERLVATVPGVERKGAKMPYTSANGNMSSFLDSGTLALRLSKDDRDRFIAEFGTGFQDRKSVV